MHADLEAAAQYLLPEIGFEPDLQLFSPLQQARFQALDDTEQVSGLRGITQADAGVDAEPAQVDGARQRSQQSQCRLHGDPSQALGLGPSPFPGCPLRCRIDCLLGAPPSLMPANRFSPGPGFASGPQAKGDAWQGALTNGRTQSPGARTCDGDPDESEE